MLCCSVAYPKRHTQADISDIYRLPLATRGVFTNVALQEPFGLTVIEACPVCLSCAEASAAFRHYLDISADYAVHCLSLGAIRPHLASAAFEQDPDHELQRRLGALQVPESAQGQQAQPLTPCTSG